MTKAVIYNKEMLEVIKEDLNYLFEQCGRLNISYEKASKEGTAKQKGFIFAAQIKGITEYLQDCGFNVDDVDVRYKLYKDVSKVLPDIVVDKQIFGGQPRIKHIDEILKDRTLASKFIDCVFYLLDTDPLYAGIQLHPSVYYNWVFHLDPEEVKWAKQNFMPERDSNYLDYVRTLPCICCGIQHRSEAHHLKDNRLGGISQKSPDWTALPLCHNCHLGIAHGSGWHEAMKWIPYELDDFTRLCYQRWKNKNG